MIEIARLDINDADTILDLVSALLTELRDTRGVFSASDTEKIMTDWTHHTDRLTIFAAYDGSTPVGILTLAENFAFYATGSYGIINEMYILPDHRSDGIGKKLIAAAIAYGRDRHWRRIDVTAPAGEEWTRTVRFYEREGFVLAGPKLRFQLD